MANKSTKQLADSSHNLIITGQAGTSGVTLLKFKLTITKTTTVII